MLAQDGHAPLKVAGPGDEADGLVWVLVDVLCESLRGEDGQAQLFLQLPRERSGLGLSGLHLPPGQLP